ncbi:hypothetical protein Scep_007001 [Stephania cephalantha]|uniref:Uncharacterized protein n=1 Tax=Stephania cephalantha TaxID=152367 RepID=A0AAP0KAN7_9MAGN
MSSSITRVRKGEGVKSKPHRELRGLLASMSKTGLQIPNPKTMAAVKRGDDGDDGRANDEEDESDDDDGEDGRDRQSRRRRGLMRRDLGLGERERVRDETRELRVCGAVKKRSS